MGANRDRRADPPKGDPLLALNPRKVRSDENAPRLPIPTVRPRSDGVRASFARESLWRSVGSLLRKGPQGNRPHIPQVGAPAKKRRLATFLRKQSAWAVRSGPGDKAPQGLYLGLKLWRTRTYRSESHDI
jgi:hypothetical protein